MHTTSCIPTHKSLARGYARQAFDIASQQSADTVKILNGLHDLAPNRKNRERTAKRLRKRSGVIKSMRTPGGVSIVLRSTLDVTMSDDQGATYTEPRISWMHVETRSGRGKVGFSLGCVCPSSGILGQMAA